MKAQTTQNLLPEFIHYDKNLEQTFGPKSCIQMQKTKQKHIHIIVKSINILVRLESKRLMKYKNKKKPTNQNNLFKFG